MIPRLAEVGFLEDEILDFSMPHDIVDPDNDPSDTLYLVDDLGRYIVDDNDDYIILNKEGD